MTVKLNKKALEKARALLKNGDVVHDARDDWSEHAPSTDEQNRFIEKNGWDEYALWHLGVDDDANEGTKKRYSFPYGDFRRVHRSGLIACVYRASEWRHKPVELAAHDLLQHLDETSG